MEKKWAVLGFARHGKDTVASLLQELLPTLRFCSSSEFVMEKAVWPILQPKYGYETKQQCFEDRINHRAEWYQLITGYNSPDKSKLASELLEENDIYVGLRSREELLACKEKNLFDVILWVDRSKHVAPETEASCTIRSTDCDYIIDNNDSLEETMKQLKLVLRAVE